MLRILNYNRCRHMACLDGFLGGFIMMPRGEDEPDLQNDVSLIGERRNAKTVLSD